MSELDRQIRATLQTLVSLQGAKIMQLERENSGLQSENTLLKKEAADLKFKYADRIAGSKKEVQA